MIDDDRRVVVARLGNGGQDRDDGGDGGER